MTDPEPYDAALDGFRSWQLGIAELRKKGLREGKFLPESDDERAYVRSLFNEGGK